MEEGIFNVVLGSIIFCASPIAFIVGSIWVFNDKKRNNGVKLMIAGMIGFVIGISLCAQAGS